jgi:hypothetical protein
MMDHDLATTITIPDNIQSDEYYIAVPNYTYGIDYTYNIDTTRTVVFRKVPVYHRIPNEHTYILVKSYKWVPETDCDDDFNDAHTRDLINEINALRNFINSGIIGEHINVPLLPLNEPIPKILKKKASSNFDDIEELFTL